MSKEMFVSRDDFIKWWPFFLEAKKLPLDTSPMDGDVMQMFCEWMNAGNEA